MSWLLPGFFGATLAVALPIALHFLRSKPKTVVVFPTLRFLAQSAIQDTRKHRLMRLITLAMRCLIIALLAMAFARPFFANTRLGQGRVMIVAVDNSMSMQARGRWEALRNWALSQLAELQPGDQAGILLMQPTPAWMAPISGNIDEVRATLHDLKPGFEKTHYMPALRMAGQALGRFTEPQKTLIWMADEQRVGWAGAQFDETLPAGVKVRFPDPAPQVKSQAAITALRWGRDGLDPAVEVRTQLFAPATQTRKITVKSGGKLVAERTVTLKAGDEQMNQISVKTAPEAVRQGVTVSMDADDLGADDIAWLAPRGESARTVLYSPGSGPGSHFVDHALQSLEQFDPDPLVDKPFPDGDWPAGAVAIATGDCFKAPELDRLNRFVAGGGAVWMVVDGAEEQKQWLLEHGVNVIDRPESEEPVHLRDWDLDHPILGAFAGQSVMPLMEVDFERGYGLMGEDLTAIANWPDGSAGIAELSVPGGRILVSGFPLDRTATNWPIQPTFVPFVHETLRWLAAPQETKSDWRIGDTIPLKGKDGTWHAIEAERAQPDQKVSGSVRPMVPGLYEFTDGKTREVFAVNSPAGESDLTPWPHPEQLAAFESKATPEKQQAAEFAAVKLSGAAAESHQRLWWWVLAILAATLLAELAVANRTAM